MPNNLSELDTEETTVDVTIQPRAATADDILKESNLEFEKVFSADGRTFFWVHELPYSAIRTVTKLARTEGREEEVPIHAVIHSLRDKPNGRLLLAEKDIQQLADTLGSKRVQQLADVALRLSGIKLENKSPAGELDSEQAAGN